MPDESRRGLPPHEIARLQRARAVARRAALREACEVIDTLRAQIERNNPGRGRGSVSQIGQFAADAVKRAGDAVWAMRAAIEVPAAACRLHSMKGEGDDAG